MNLNVVNGLSLGERKFSLSLVPDKWTINPNFVAVIDDGSKIANSVL